LTIWSKSKTLPNIQKKRNQRCDYATASNRMSCHAKVVEQRLEPDDARSENHSGRRV
jgi:hypothetical protein